MLCHRSSRFSPGIPSCYHLGDFSLNSRCRVSRCRAGLPLRTHFNPYYIHYGQSRSFPLQHLNYLLASFAVMVSSRTNKRLDPGLMFCYCLHYHFKAGYTVLLYSKNRLTWPCYVSSNSTRPPRERGQRPHAIVDRPKPLSLCKSPRLGVSSHYKELHRCALGRIFSPAFKDSMPTRILHHLHFK